MRAVGLPDLLIAAVAERERITVLHYDGDYGYGFRSALLRPANGDR